ncbi:MAG TPA: hypothetical protein VK524_30400, partial [Polyangiaceae bacterium]|nr:hypothetical protein [Polyangiaceae bacterium]
VYLSLGGSLFEKKSATGARLWRHGSPGVLMPSKVAIVPGGFTFASQLSGTVTINGSTYSSQTGSVVGRINADGSYAWTKLVDGGSASGLAADGTGRVVVAGRVPPGSDFVAIGSERITVPRSYEAFTFLAWFAANGALERLRLLDGDGNVDVTLGPDGSIYLALGSATRPFYFEPAGAPGNYVYGVGVAKLTQSGELVFSRNLGPHMFPGVPTGYLELLPTLITVSGSRVFTAGTPRSVAYFPPSVFPPEQTPVTSYWVFLAGTPL